MKQFIWIMVVLAVAEVIQAQEEIVEEETTDEVQPTCSNDNEEYNFCGTATEASCNFQDRRKRSSRCISGCFCKENFVRNSDNKCILKTDCPARTCSEATEEFLECGPGCDVTCENHLVKDEIVAECEKPCISGCFCKLGYVHNYLGQCVPTSKCIQRF